MTQVARSYAVFLTVATFLTTQCTPECVSHATLKCINDASSFWPRCDPSQSKMDNFPTLHGRAPSDYGHFCTQPWADAINEMLSHSVVDKCGDTDAQIKLLAQIAVETGYFTTLFQPADGGAGLVHMIPGNWPINAQDMEDLFGGNFVQRQAASGVDFFQTPSDGWLSVAAWYKLTNRVIPGCGKDLFDEPFMVQTQCIFARANDRSEAFNIVSQCFGATPSTNEGSCSGDPCADVSLCRSKFGHCGSSPDHCNSESTWKAAGCGTTTTFSAKATTTTTGTTTTIAGTTATESTTTTTTTSGHTSATTTATTPSPVSTTTTVTTSISSAAMTSGNDSGCSGTPCVDVTLCRSKWGFCGSSSQHCNAESTWKASGCKVGGGDGCPGAPCSDTGHCRSKWGHCGVSTQHCNHESTWKATGCSQIQFAALLFEANLTAGTTTSAASDLSHANRNLASIGANFIMMMIFAFGLSPLAK